MLGTLFLVLIVELLKSSVEAAIDRISSSEHALSKGPRTMAARR